MYQKSVFRGMLNENNEDRRKEAMIGDGRGFFASAFETGAMRMAILLRQLCEKASYLYGMRILAGENGTGNIVQWIHTLEDVETGGFIHGGELIFTTGIAQKGNEWLLEFVENLYEREACGLVVNVGPYITSVPQSVIDYCNKMNFPLLEVPWKTRLVDITRDFSNQIFQNEKEEENLADTLKNIVFDPKNAREYLPALARNNFNINGKFCIMGIDIDFLNRNVYRQKMFRSHLLRRVERMVGTIGYFVSSESIFIVLNDFTNEEIHDLAKRLEEQEGSETVTLKIAVSQNETGIEHLPGSYQKVCTLLRLARKRGESPLFYDEFGARKILLSVGDSEVLQDYYHETLGALERYDRENDTQYLDLLRRYLELDGSVQALADTVYVHRNTINYQLNKIKKILGRDFGSLQSRYELILAYQVRELL